MAAHLCGLLWLAGARTGDRSPCRCPFCLRLVNGALAAHPPLASDHSAHTAGNFQRSIAALFEYSRRALMLVWTTNRALSIALAALTVLAGVLPAGVAYIGALIVDAVIHAAELHHRTGATAFGHVLSLVGCEAALVALTALAQRGLSL